MRVVAIVVVLSSLAIGVPRAEAQDSVLSEADIISYGGSAFGRAFIDDRAMATRRFPTAARFFDRVLRAAMQADLGPGPSAQLPTHNDDRRAYGTFSVHRMNLSARRESLVAMTQLERRSNGTRLESVTPSADAYTDVLALSIRGTFFPTLTLEDGHGLADGSQVLHLVHQEIRLLPYVRLVRVREPGALRQGRPMRTKLRFGYR